VTLSPSCPLAYLHSLRCLQPTCRISSPPINVNAHKRRPSLANPRSFIGMLYHHHHFSPHSSFVLLFLSEPFLFSFLNSLSLFQFTPFSLICSYSFYLRNLSGWEENREAFDIYIGNFQSNQAVLSRVFHALYQPGKKDALPDRRYVRLLRYPSRCGLVKVFLRRPGHQVREGLQRTYR